QDLRPIRAIRKNRKAVSPVIATILMVAITVVLAAVLYVMVSGLVSGPGSTPTAIGVSVSQTPDGTNWQLVFADVPAGKAPAAVSLVIFSSSGTVLFTKTAIDTLSGTNETYVQIDGAATSLGAGDKILLAVAAYPAGSTYQLVDANGVLASGTLQ
ncbi:MAG: archaellin/type IV pilin N-terminal domain-containing protein, partial [Thermoplasmata archaeon]